MGKPRKKKKRLTRPLEGWLTWAVVRSIGSVVRALPHSVLGRWGDFLGRICYRSMPRYRRVALANLRRAFGAVWDDEQIVSTARATFCHVGRNLVEFLWMPGRDMSKLVTSSGLHYLNDALAGGRGVILFSAHFGNWEIMPSFLTGAGFQLHTVFRESEHNALNRLIVRMREQSGQQLLPRQHSVRAALGALKRNEIFAVLLDQNTIVGGVFVPFFGIPASTAAGPATIAARTGAPMVPIFSSRQPDGSHHVEVLPPLLPDPASDTDSEVLRLTAAATALIESQILGRPEQWLWIHNRWKLRPDGSKLA